MSSTILIIGGICLLLCFLFPLVSYISGNSCYRVKKIENVYKNRLKPPYYVIEQFHKLWWISWWECYAELGSIPTTFYDVADVEAYIKELLRVDPKLRSKESVSNVICKDSPEVKLTFD